MRARWRLLSRPLHSFSVMLRSFQNTNALKFHLEFFEEFLQIPDMFYHHVRVPAFILQ